ncbi:hypothetical protein [Paenibacillus woosongensis]|uniref:Helix-turn-helix domain-containing protein n=1 Tax=Paenibacillus woosongensis TaxID=307580 RepID=A0ABQ4MPQ4_9BACL|nr:hypothetical protein [Paenibacillus woosongensis]GIP57879.1 hypothetical protein J15TS10_16930 [Paenibacillus woosongensis]
MIVTRDVWLELTRDERMVCLRYAASENAKRWQKEKQLTTAPTP